MKESFGVLPNGRQAFLYTISCGGLTISATDLGAALVKVIVPDRSGRCADVVLGFDRAEDYLKEGGCLGATVGRCANRIKGASFYLNGRLFSLSQNEKENSLHSGPDVWYHRLWDVPEETENSLTFRLLSPDVDQGYPGNMEVRVTYRLDQQQGLHIIYEAVSDQDTVFNPTNHSYFNLSGHEHPEKAMDQQLTLYCSSFLPADEESIPSGEIRSAANTPMDFLTPKTLGRDLSLPYAPLRLQGGYDHHFIKDQNLCAILNDPLSGRTMTISTDCPGLQVYTGNYLNTQGKGGVFYGKRSGVALETQFPPDSLHHASWPQPIIKANRPYRSETVLRFSAK